jgi:hypothetical protein
MTRNDIIQLAREAGFSDHSSPEMWGVMVASHEEIERFAKLVAKVEREKEREACAKLCLETEPFYGAMFAAAIRARGESK